MFGSPAESEVPAASPKPEATPEAPGGVPVAGADAASKSDVGAGMAVAWADTAAAGPDGAVEAIRAREVEVRAMWQASVMAKPAAQGADAMTAAAVGLTASARSEPGVAGLAQSGAGTSSVPAVDGRAGVTAGPSDGDMRWRLESRLLSRRALRRQVLQRFVCALEVLSALNC